MKSFAQSVFERYLNPFVHHELMSIALNSLSKYKARVLPTIKDYYSINNSLPKHAVFSLAALIKFYEGKRGEEEIALKDDPNNLTFFKELYLLGLKEEEIVLRVLSNKDIWGEDLSSFASLKDEVTSYLKEINQKGMKEALISFLGE